MSLTASLPALLGLASILYLALAVHLLRRSPQSLIGLFVLAFGIIVAGPVFYYGTDDAVRYGIGRVLSYAGSGLVPVLFFALYRQFVGAISRPVIGALLVIPAITVLLALSNAWHGLLWVPVASEAGNGFTDINRHAWFRYVFAPYAYGLFGFTWIALLSRLDTIAPAQRGRITLLLVISALPFGISFANTMLGLGSIEFPFTAVTIAACLPIYAYAGLSLSENDFSPLGYRTVFDHVRDPIIVLDTRQCIVSANKAACDMLGSSERELLGRLVFEAMPDANDLLADEDSMDLTQTLQLNNNVTYEVSVSRLTDRRGRELGTVITCRDATQRRRTLGQLAENEQLIRTLIETSSNGILRFAVDDKAEKTVYRCVFANPAAASWLGASPEELVGRTLSSIESLKPERLLQHFASEEKRNRQLAFEHAVEDADGAVAWLRITAEPIGADFSVTIADITRRKAEEERMLQEALRDPLTGVLNRRGFEAQAQERMRRMQRGAIVYLDLNGFKQVNDRYGHQAGDALLKAFGHRLGYCLRPEDILGRLGGDEFAIVLPDVDAEDAAHIAERLGSTGSEAYIIKGQEIHCSASVGLALCPAHGEELWHLVSVADQAMYANKGAANEDNERTDSVHGEFRQEHSG